VSTADNTDIRTTAGARVLYVTGKGGAGKSTLANALCLAATAADLSVVRVTLGEASDCTPTPGGVTTIALDGRRALGHLLERVLLLRVLSRRVLASRTFNAVAAAAPGLSDLVMLSFLADVADGHAETGAVDLVVVDGFASGHAQAMLEAPLHAADLLGMGPGRDLIDRCRRLTTDATRFRVAVVAAPEELPVTEAFELWQALTDAGIGLLPPALNTLYPALLSAEQAEYVRSGNCGPQARWYEATYSAQRSWVRKLASLTTCKAVEFEYDFADGEITPAAAASLLECWP
jgi:anion-transporting  ArsA/GET3 family ATPase